MEEPTLLDTVLRERANALVSACEAYVANGDPSQFLAHPHVRVFYDALSNNTRRYVANFVVNWGRGEAMTMLVGLLLNYAYYDLRKPR